MNGNVVSIADWKAQQRRNQLRGQLVLYPVELLRYEDGLPVWRWEMIDASSAGEPKVDPL
jgi:hypothetical protein